MIEGPHRRAVPWSLLLAASCASITPDDAAPAIALRPDPAFAANFPAATTIADGIDDRGERALREGDRLALGVEVALGDDVERHLLEVIVHRCPLAHDAGLVTFTSKPHEGHEATHIPQRHTRLVDLELVLRTPEGDELQRSRLERVPEFVLDESFVPAMRSSAEDDPRTYAVAYLRLIEIANMLQSDPILQDLLHKAATVPLDITLLWRRELTLTPYFDHGRLAEDQGTGRFELPFDLFLNDSLLVRLVATVTEPHGASGAIGGIVGLRAQDARHPDRRLTVRVLGAARGPASEWRQRGVSIACRYADEGMGMAFSPDGRLLAMPGPGDGIELHDLHGDASRAHRASCAGTAKDLAFLDERTLLVACSHQVQVFRTAPGATPLLLATHEVPDWSVRTLEVVDDETVFFGGNGFAIERWRFAEDRGAAPQRELVQEERREPAHATMTAAGGTVSPVVGFGWYLTNPGAGWLYPLGADCVVARDDEHETRWQRTADGSWTSHELPRVERPTSRRRRLPDPPPGVMFDRVAKGLSLVRDDEHGVHAFGAGPLSLSGPSGTRVLNRVTDWPDYCHGFSPDGRYYAYVAPGYRLLVDVERFFAAGD